VAKRSSSSPAEPEGAWAIFHSGKDVENRTWRANHHGSLLIHASKTRQSYDQEDPDEWQRWLAFSWTRLTTQ
jgi:hypothetical protein